MAVPLKGVLASGSHRSAVGRCVALAPALALVALSLASAGVLSFGLAWLDVVVLPFVYPTPPTNSLALALLAAGIYGTRKPFQHVPVATPVAVAAIGIAITKPILGMTGQLQSLWTISNPAMVCLLAIAFLALQQRRLVLAQSLAGAACLVATLSFVGLIYGFPIRPSGALALVIGSAFSRHWRCSRARPTAEASGISCAPWTARRCRTP